MADTGRQAPKLHQVLASCMILRNDAAGAESEIKQHLAVAPLAADAEKMKAILAELEAGLAVGASAPSSTVTGEKRGQTHFTRAGCS
jgi:hypothetical protein